MNATLLYAFRNLGRRRTRTIAGVLGIFITLTFLTSIQVGLDSLSFSYIDLVALQAGKADLLIARPDNDPFNPQAFDPGPALDLLKADPTLRGVSPRLVGTVQVRYGGEEHYAVMVGLDAVRERELDLSGFVPEATVERDGCAISRTLADKLKLKSGARVSVRSPVTYTDLPLKLGTIVERQLLLPQQVRDFVIVSLVDAREILGETTQVHSLAGALKDPQNYYDARDLHASVQKLKAAGAKIAGQLGKRYEVRVPKAAAIGSFQEFGSPLRAVFGVFALLGLAITGLLIYSLVSVSVEERIREYGVLRTLGAKRREIFRLVLLESVILCFLGVVPGVLGGIIMARGIVALLGLILGGKASLIALTVAPRVVGFTLASGAGLSIGSALVPAWRATRWRIVDALDPLRRGQLPASSTSSRVTDRPLLAAGLVIATLAVIVFFVLPAAIFSGSPSLIGTVVLCLLLCMFFGFTMAAVGVLPWLQWIVLRLAGPFLGIVTDLVGRNLERHRRRHTTTALLFTISVALVIFTASLFALCSRTAVSMVEHMYGADLRIQSPRSGSESLKPELSATPGVKRVSEVRYLRSRSELGTAYDVVIRDLVGMKSLWVVPFGVDGDLTDVLYPEQVVCDSGDPGALGRLKGELLPDEGPQPQPPPVVLSPAIARFLNVRAGDDVQLSFVLGADRTEARFRVAAIYSSMPGFENFRARVANAVGSALLISIENFSELTRAAPSEVFQALYFVRAEGERDAQKNLARRVRDDFDVRYRFGVQCTAEQKDEARAVYWATQIFFGLLLVVAIVIAVFALVASMATTVIERRREIGVLKALGLRRRQLFRIFFGEAVVLTLASGTAGGAIGFTLAWLFVFQASVLAEIPVVFTMPYLTFIATLVISVVSGAIAAWLPTRALLVRTAAEILRV